MGEIPDDFHSKYFKDDNDVMNDEQKGLDQICSQCHNSFITIGRCQVPFVILPSLHPSF